MQTKNWNKVFADADSALWDFTDHLRVMVGGFGLSGNPENSISAIAQKGSRHLTVISNNCGNQGKGLALLLQNKQVDRVICSYIGGNPDLEAQLLRGEIDVELNPQGTLAERIRAGGAGLGGFFTPTGVGTVVAEGKEERVIDGKRMILETPLHADVTIIRAHVGDKFGNLKFYRTSRNFCPMMAMAAQTTIVEVEHLVEVGDLDPDEIHLPGIFVTRIFEGRHYENPIEQLTVRS